MEMRSQSDRPPTECRRTNEIDPVVLERLRTKYVDPVVLERLRTNYVDPEVLERLQGIEDNDATLRETFDAADALLLLHKEASAIVALSEVREEKQEARQRSPTRGRRLVENAHIVTGQALPTEMYGREPFDEESGDITDNETTARSRTVSAELEQGFGGNAAIPRASERQRVSSESNLPVSGRVYIPSGRELNYASEEARRNAEGVAAYHANFMARQNAPARSTTGRSSRRSEPAAVPQTSSTRTRPRLSRKNREVLAAMGDDNDDEIEAARNRIKNRRRR